ncbi:tyrosine-type recombinase/integrase [Brevibacillus laterosporus]|uniref:tyrosine-type recombinase/integrase n=1 Tax=Brevibacillus laterosporus TaxID=1465 RepID=UPI0013CE760F|nr:tyrosine-type recombinase/integrase [Brevibacillus laterosporus]
MRTELEIEVPKASKKLPYVPTEEELKRYYEVVRKSKNFQDMMIVKTLMYTGIRVSELINIRLTDID